MNGNTYFRSTLLAAAFFAGMVCALAAGSGVNGVQRVEKTPYQPTGAEGSISGIVRVEGEVPAPRLISMDADPACTSQYKEETRLDDLLVRDGKLANALVYVESSALDGLEFAPPQTAAVLDRRKCRTVPHVLGVQAGQTIQVLNNDLTTHNYNFRTTKNERMNKSIAAAGKGFQIAFAQPEMFVTVVCNQHPWERGYIAVMPHPFFAVTDRNGAFSIEGLPPGDYTVVAWHEKFIEQRLKVSIGWREVKEVNFTYKVPEDQH
jgi:plastocyanin